MVNYDYSIINDTTMYITLSNFSTFCFMKLIDLANKRFIYIIQLKSNNRTEYNYLFEYGRVRSRSSVSCKKIQRAQLQLDLFY